MQNNYYLEKLEKKAKLREEKKLKEKTMKVSGKSVFEIQKQMKEIDNEKSS